ncbi:hypothetical protein E2C01_064046 [Portunus trituberculatus]|uniref:Uncharacterized protein n=1 Tax=Portunus trituberculatus TaxID=210409 RepID=A0A5B7HJU1_PORTR|nr:hypothetical protein [Portunus trituberculatus]
MDTDEKWVPTAAWTLDRLQAELAAVTEGLALVHPGPAGIAVPAHKALQTFIEMTSQTRHDVTDTRTSCAVPLAFAPHEKHPTCHDAL